ncbi:MAG: PQQ-binding-like beta-propeller repeat protein [Acetobacteraceae bacterium]|nr:PQQ-binding-like beta-propeller repeat protein [Acetobacteraceae bacterium]
MSSGIVYTMDSDAAVSAFDLATGRRRWRQKTRSDKDRSTNVGGGLALEGGTLYSVNGLAELVALDPASGQVRWRKDIGAPARSSPTIAESRILVTTIEDKLLALATDDGRLLWSHQASARPTSFLGQPAPAYAEGMVVAGFGSGELAALRGETGLVVWTDSLAGGRSLLTAADISAIRGRPAISNGQVYAIGLGGWMVGLDLRSGRRVWEKEVAGQDSPWIAGDWMFVLSTQQQIAAVSRSDGRAAWVTDLPRWKDEKKREGPIFWFGPLLVGERLVVAGTNREALAVSPYTGAILGRQKLDGAGSLGPVVANGTVLIITDEGTLLALR